jgi:hypothetical protein
VAKVTLASGINSLSAEQYTSAVASKITNTGLTINGLTNAASVTALAQDAHVQSVTLSTSTTDLLTNLSSLSSSNVVKLLSSNAITLTDAVGSNIAITTGNWNAYQTVLKDVSNLAAANVTITNINPADIPALANSIGNSGLVDKVSLASGITSLRLGECQSLGRSWSSGNGFSFACTSSQ